MHKLMVTAGVLFCFCDSAFAQAHHAAGSRFTAFACIVLGGISLNVYLFRLLQPVPRHDSLDRPARWVSKLEFAPAAFEGFSWWQLVLWSLLSLFLELLVIRWISSEIRIFAYFKNFVLIGCFLGFGLGCYLSRRRVNVLLLIIPLLALTLVITLPWEGLRFVMSSLPDFIGTSSEVHLWGVPSLPVDAASLLLFAGGVAIIIPIFGLVSFLFIPLGQLVGWYLENARRGTLAYSVNILGSLAGIILYTLLCFFYQPPTIWFSVAGLVLVGLLWRLPCLRWTVITTFFICLGLLTLSPQRHSQVYWSPYQKLTLTSREDAGRIVEYSLTTNGSWYQQILDLSPGFVASHRQLFEEVPIEWNAYNLPYHFYQQPPSVLVLGSGMGNDVAAALRNGAGQVKAVEIDPLILELGERFHFERPYSSPRVQIIENDARSYVQNSNDRFDLIVFSLLDSHTTSSHFANIRIDNYVYTLEALQATKRLLRPDGIFVIKFDVETPWIAGRLYGLLKNAFGSEPIEVQADAFSSTPGGRFFITGSQQRIAQAMSDSQLTSYVTRHRDLTMLPARLTTDDWPYFYQHEPGLPASVIVISGVLLVLCSLFLRKSSTLVRSVRWHFFLLGAGFMLLEAQIISKMALLFGTTWLVNSIVIAGLLLLIVTANILVEFSPRFPMAVAYVGIFVTLLASYLIPLESFFLPSLWTKALISTLVLCLPVFFAGTVFIRSFAEEGFRSKALGSNLLGAMIGGILESVSLWTGIRSLLFIAAFLYLASWIALGLERSFSRSQSQNGSEAASEILVAGGQGTE
jgi:spermidine synthase